MEPHGNQWNSTEVSQQFHEVFTNPELLVSLVTLRPGMILSFPTTFSKLQWLTLCLIPALCAGCWTSSTFFFHPSAYTCETSIVSGDIISGSWNPGLVCCRWENGSMHILPMETSFGHWNMLLLSQDENPIIGRIFAGNPNIWFFRCLPNRDIISSLNPPNSHDPNGGTYVRIGGLLKEK